ncbi:GatB/YqeY domain-containing protein [Halothermothrix orenii]|uniref:GatB/Yqey domain protein n=1 Tax=Halothermothrix orenii (strain H 168 / OCM 544 / DSM 9562) TaxID=373903 RepID=B8CXK5_HALOH|nr:GatB/YqeY domain-containing protein [Halothermothrix orenii]ACL70024.1 GatB/Yqey domain protein [Halothermothrix orenii H 168]
MKSLKEQLVEDMKKAMKEKDKMKLSVIRMARAAIKNVEINKRKDLSDDEVVEVLAKEVKQRRESIEEYKKAGKENVVKDLDKEIEILSKYLPEQLTKEEIEKIVDEVISEVNAESMKDMGKVMQIIMPRIRGRADGKVVNNIVRKKLS